MGLEKETITLETADLEELYQKCEPFDECKLRMEDPDYDRALQKYLGSQAALEQQLTEEQVGQLYACVDGAQECMSFEVMHFLRQGFLLGLSVQLGHIIQGLVPPDNAASEKTIED